jgi:hypothetical protein
MIRIINQKHDRWDDPSRGIIMDDNPIVDRINILI